MTDNKERQTLFVLEYMKDQNASQAALRAGYKRRNTGPQLYAKPHIKAMIAEEMERRKSVLRVAADRVLAELAMMAHWDPKDYTHIKTPEDIKKLPDMVRNAVIGWEYDKDGQFKIKLSSKDAALEKLGRHLKLFTDKVELSGNLGLAERLKAARERTSK